MIYPSQEERAAAGFIPWQPSTWPEPPAAYDENFRGALEQIFEETILEEIANVISDAHKANGNLTHRGHVVALALLCAVDSIGSYASPHGDRVGTRYKKFITAFFPDNYKPFAGKIYELHRNSLVHNWNLFEGTMLPGNEPVTKTKHSLSFGLLDFFDALNHAVHNFLSELPKRPDLQQNCLARYAALRALATK